MRRKIREATAKWLNLVVSHPLTLNPRADTERQHPEQRHHHCNREKQQRTHARDAGESDTRAIDGDREPGTCEIGWDCKPQSFPPS